jgi:hypothetical protein
MIKSDFNILINTNFLSKDLQLPNLKKFDKINNLVSNKQEKQDNIVKNDKFTHIKLDTDRRLKISYEDLLEESILGSGQYGIVKKMLHKQSGLTFAV